MKLLGISGKIGTGKTTLARHILEHCPGGKRLPFGGVLKDEVARMAGIPRDWCDTHEGKAREVSFQHEGVPLRMSVRGILQWYGTDICRASDPRYWVKRMANTMALCNAPVVIIDDVRFPDEAAFIRDRGGLLLRLAQYRGWVPGPNAGHESETALDNWSDWDLLAAPAFGDLPAVAAMAIGLLEGTE